MLRPSEPRSGPVPEGLMLQYLVVLAGTDPLVWRRLRVPATYTFWDLHVAIQDGMGWLDYHLHSFHVSDPASGILTLGIPDTDALDDWSPLPDWNFFPLDFASTDALIQYTYDFGDDWRHALLFEGYEQSELAADGPQCIAGAGRCPPEDCGGSRRYVEVLAALENPDHPEHESWKEWVGEDFDPDSFSIDDVVFADPEARWNLAFSEGES